jgi:hypothetical protein
MKVLVRLQQLFWRAAALTLVLMSIAYAQLDVDEAKEQRLPEMVLGTWRPMTRNYLGLGDFVIEAETLTWGACLQEPYRVLHGRDSLWVLELARSPACPRSGPPASFWSLEIARNGQVFDLTVMRCKDLIELEKEIDKPLTERGCNGWGRFRRGVD